jgi:hypothetical protein
MNDVGTTHEDLERFLAGHHMVGAGLRREGRNDGNALGRRH